jgi:hypothetical protein
MKKRILIPVLALTVIPHIHAAVWSAGGDLRAYEMTSSDTINANGQWTYGYRSAVLGSSLTLFTNTLLEHTNAVSSVPNLEGWVGQSGYPVVATNTSSAPIPIATSSLGLQELGMHPDKGSLATTYVIARWTAPASSTFGVSYTWRDLDAISGDGFSADLVYVNSSSVASSLFNASVSNGSFTSNSQSITLAAGEHLDFIVGPGAAGDYNYDTTALLARIDGVPEPTSALLGALGLISTVLRRKR